MQRTPGNTRNNVLIITLFCLMIVINIAGCSQRTSPPPSSPPQTQKEQEVSSTSAKEPQTMTGQIPSGPIKSLVIAGKITFENDIKPADVKELGEGENKRKYYSYTDGSIEVVIDAIKYSKREGLLWVDEAGLMSFQLAFEAPITLPQKGTFTIKRTGYKDIVLKDLDINTDPFALPEINMKSSK